MSQFLLSEVVDKVATIRLNRPEKLNAFTDDMIAAWIDLLERYRTADDVHVIVITGSGRAFSTGGDVGKFADYAANTAAGIKARLTENVQRLVLKVREIDKPVIAAVNGLATGGGVDVALMCDVRFAARSARLAETYVRMGLIPGAGGAYFLPRLVGAAKALELFWSSEPIGAEEALRIGLVNRVFDDDRLAEETQAFARKLAQGAPLAMRLVKKILYQGLESDLRAALDLAASNMPVVRMSEDHKEAVAAFREKREPVFTGR
ncbi:MAG: enoyl-CoA hydratase/isomerase family protein [Burkholderiales bacterium]|nr:enoyl-CoA hydratase/isomerase family protein [Burkholderiales bacterium]